MSLFSRYAFRTIAMVIPALTLPALALAQAAAGGTASEPSTVDFGVRRVRHRRHRYSAEPGGGAQRAVCRSQGFARVSSQDGEDRIFGARWGRFAQLPYAIEPFAAGSYDGGAVFAADLTSRLKVGASVNSAYSPRFVFSLLPVAGDIAPDVAPPPLDYAISSQRMTSYAVGSTRDTSGVAAIYPERGGQRRGAEAPRRQLRNDAA